MRASERLLFSVKLETAERPPPFKVMAPPAELTEAAAPRE